MTFPARMFCGLRRRQKEDQKRHPVVPATSSTAASAVAEAPVKKTAWWRRLLRQKTKTKQTPVKDGVVDGNFKESECGEAEVQVASPTPEPPIPAASELEIQIKNVAEDTDLPSSAAEKSVDTIKESEDGEAEVEEASPTPEKPVTATTELKLQDTNVSNISDTVQESEGVEASSQEASPIRDPHVSAAKVLQPEAEELLNCIDAIKESESGEAVIEEASPDPETPVSAATETEDGVQHEEEEVSTSLNITSTATECGGVDVKETSSAPENPVSTATETGDGVQHEEEEVSTSLNITSTATECGGVDVKESSSAPENPSSTATETGKKKKKPWWRRWFFSCCKKSDSSVETEERAGQADVDSCGDSTVTNSNVQSCNLPTVAHAPRQPTPAGHGGSQKAKNDSLSVSTTNFFKSVGKDTLSKEELRCLGLPNLWQTCYLNSTLQGLLTLTPFVQEVQNQQRVWNSCPNSQLFSGFADIQVCRFFNNKAEKKIVLDNFKNTVAELNSEFQNNSAKDAFEFLGSVLDGLRSLAVDFQTAAVDMGISYTCPVNAHIAFQMLRTRTCLGCGLQSMSEEDCLSLSLDLAPGGSVSNCLENYQNESRLEYHCACGAQESSQQCSFLTLPNVLIFQLKRFLFTRSFKLRKKNNPVVISRELLLNSKFNSNKQTCYSLVSIISHLGSSADYGHYICDGVQHQKATGDVTDRWLTYNDMNVSETTGKSVCHRRQRTAYVLFYIKQE